MSDHTPTPEEIKMAKESGIQVQPDPVSNTLPSAHDLVIDEIKSVFDGAEGIVPELQGFQTMFNDLVDMYVVLNGGEKAAVKEMNARKEFGLRKYQTLLQPFNGRDAKSDAIDEMGDLLVYMAVLLYELRNPQETG